MKFLFIFIRTYAVAPMFKKDAVKMCYTLKLETKLHTYEFNRFMNIQNVNFFTWKFY